MRGAQADCTETTRTEMEIMEAGMPTPPWPTNEPMDAIDRLRVDGQPDVRTYRTTTKGKTRYPLEDTHLAGEAQTVCQAPFARPETAPRTAAGPQVRKSRRTSTRRPSKRLAATIDSVEAPETVR